MQVEASSAQAPSLRRTKANTLLQLEDFSSSDEEPELPANSRARRTVQVRSSH